MIKVYDSAFTCGFIYVNSYTASLHAPLLGAQHSYTCNIAYRVFLVILELRCDFLSSAALFVQSLILLRYKRFFFSYTSYNVPHPHTLSYHLLYHNKWNMAITVYRAYRLKQPFVRSCVLGYNLEDQPHSLIN